MVLDWYCPDCGTQGTAVALKAGEAMHRVLISHRYARSPQKSSRQNKCNAPRIRYASRWAKAPKPAPSDVA